MMRPSNKKNASCHWHGLALAGVLAVALLATSVPISAQQSSVISTVSVSPLTIDLSARSSVFIDQKFNIKAVVENKGQSDITDIEVTLDLPTNATMLSGELIENIGTLKPARKKTMTWQMTASQPGDYTIVISAHGIEQGSSQEVGNTASIMVNARVKRFYHSMIESVVQFFNFLIGS